jgi:hypothetical protein
MSTVDSMSIVSTVSAVGSVATTSTVDSAAIVGGVPVAGAGRSRPRRRRRADPAARHPFEQAVSGALAIAIGRPGDDITGVTRTGTAIAVVTGRAAARGHGGILVRRDLRPPDHTWIDNA